MIPSNPCIRLIWPARHRVFWAQAQRRLFHGGVRPILDVPSPPQSQRLGGSGSLQSIINSSLLSSPPGGESTPPTWSRRVSSSLSPPWQRRSEPTTASSAHSLKASHNLRLCTAGLSW